MPFSLILTLKPTVSPGFVPVAYARSATVTVGAATPPLTLTIAFRASTAFAAALNRDSDGFATPLVVRSPLCHSLVV